MNPSLEDSPPDTAFLPTLTLSNHTTQFTARPESVDLWKAAFDELRTQHESLVRKYEQILTKNAVDYGSVSPENVIRSVLVSKREQLLHRQWRLQLGRYSIQAKDHIDRIIRVIRAFKDVGSIAVNADPLHAGLPWAGICLVLAVIMRVHLT